MSGITIPDRMFSRIDRVVPDFQSEADRQELIAKHATYEARYIVAWLGKDDELAARVCDDIPGNLMTDKAVAMTRAALQGDAITLLNLWMQELDGAVKREAETRAEKYIDELHD